LLVTVNNRLTFEIVHDLSCHSRFVLYELIQIANRSAPVCGDGIQLAILSDFSFAFGKKVHLISSLRVCSNVLMSCVALLQQY